MSGENRFRKLRYGTLKFAFDRTQILTYASYIYNNNSVRLTRKLRYSAQPVTGAISEQLNYFVAVTYISVS